MALGLLLALVLARAAAALFPLVLDVDFGAGFGHQGLDVFPEEAPERAEQEQ